MNRARLDEIRSKVDATISEPDEVWIGPSGLFSHPDFIPNAPQDILDLLTYIEELEIKLKGQEELVAAQADHIELVERLPRMGMRNQPRKDSNA